MKLNNTVSGGASFKNVTYDFGDGTPALVTDKTAGVEHTYAKDGEYALRATVRFTVNGAEKASECEAKVVETIFLTSERVVPSKILFGPCFHG